MALDQKAVQAVEPLRVQARDERRNARSDATSTSRSVLSQLPAMKKLGIEMRPGFFQVIEQDVTI